MRRKNRWIAPALGLLLPAAACDDLLQENPVSTLTPVNFYRDGSDALAALNASYQSFHEGHYVSGGFRYVLLLENATPQLTSTHGPTQYTSCWDHYLCQPDNAVPQNLWEHMYTSINRTNAVIDNVPKIEDMDAGLQARVVAEARFLRAVHYFNLVRLFGGVPLKLEETQDLQDLRNPRATAEEVYDLIVQDLTQAAEALPPSYPASEFGRATRGAAQALLGKVYLQRGIAGKTNPFGDPLYWPTAKPGDIDAAITNLRAVADGGQYVLVPNYADLWDVDKEMNSEVIFVVRNSELSGQGSRAYNFLNPNGVNWGNAWTNAVGELPFWQSYPEGDERRDVTWLSEYTDPSGVRRVFDPNDVKGDNFPIDCPATRKYLHEIPNHPGLNPIDFAILRYADILLMLAEAIMEKNGGPTGEAYALVNRVRERAGIGPLPAGMGYADFREALYHERQWELAQEQQTWYDAQRFWDLHTAQVIAHSRLGQTRPNKYPRGTVPKIEVVIEEPKRRLLPIPQAAIDRNSELVQNPGW